MNNYENKGITLIILVITIVLLLIIVSISIVSLTGENGLIQRVGFAEYTTEYSTVKETIDLYFVNQELEKNTFKFPVLQEKINNIGLEETLKQTIKETENLIELTEEKVELYKVNKEELGLEVRREYVLNIKSGQLYTLKGIKYNGKVYHKLENSKVNIIENQVLVQATTKLVEKGPVQIDEINYKNSYEIWNKAQLKDFRDRVNKGENFEGCIISLKADINLNNEAWIPIGNSKYYFSGSFRGERHKISSIKINSLETNQALFGRVFGINEQSAIIKDITVEGSITGLNMVAGLIGQATNTLVENCINKANVNSTDVNPSTLDSNVNIGVSATGGIIGKAELDNKGVKIINCENYGNINSNSGTIGGIIGFHRKGDIISCKNYADIGLEGERVNAVGGIVGVLEQGKIETCSNLAKVQGNAYIGGICGMGGYNNNIIKSINLNKCNNIGDINASYLVGGIVGGLLKDSSLEQVSNRGKVKSTFHDSEYWAHTGGIIGQTGLSNKISYCYNTGNIESNYRGIGGIAGRIGGSTGEVTSSIKYCYNVGNITNNSNEGYYGRTGGIYGYKYGNLDEIINCYYLKECIKKGEDSDQTGVEEKTELEIKAINWDNFSNDGNQQNKGYPILNWEK